jgi:Na+-driven multidrug efflux pump
MIMVCAFQPLNALVFVLDGYLIGARDTRYLMWAMLAGAAITIPLAWCAWQFHWELTGIVAAIGMLMLWRGATNCFRFHHGATARYDVDRPESR